MDVVKHSQVSSEMPKRSSLKKSSSTIALREKGNGSPGNFMKRNVSFNKIEIREYSMTLGDHPDCSLKNGPPISLGWEYHNSAHMGVEEYEETRQPRRTKQEMVLSCYVRQTILMNRDGFSQKELKKASTDAKKIRLQRLITKANLPLSEVETAVESIVRKMKRLCKTKKSPAPSFSV